MNAKRQTIWLVSMLSLMVILSTYYLFTEDTSKLDNTQDTATSQDVNVQTSQTTPDVVDNTTGTTSDATGSASDNTAGTNGVAKDTTGDTAGTSGVASGSSGGTATGATTGTMTGATAVNESVSTGDSNQVKSDAQILQQMATQGKSGDDYYLALQLKRNDDLSQKMQSLQSVMSDPKQAVSAVTDATNQYNQLQKEQAELDSIESQLSPEFHNVVLTEAGNKWTVNVEEASLNKSQAVSIIDLVMKDLNVGVGNVSIVLKS